MPDHFHLMITPASDIPLEKAVQFIKGGFSFRTKKELGFALLVWQESFTNHRIRDAADYERHRDYIHQNPVRKNLARTPSEYPYSSAFPRAARSFATSAKAHSLNATLYTALKGRSSTAEPTAASYSLA
jgi:putative transposase